MKDELGTRIKGLYELPEAGRKFIPMLPIIVRLDGKNFSKYTSKMERPYDVRLSGVMQNITQWLVSETNACIGYTQSDEITLIYYTDNTVSQVFFNGKIQKIVSVLASMCTAKFNELIKVEFGDMPLAFFDCRAHNVPSKSEAANALLWRELDASKNSISMLGRRHFSPLQLDRKHSGKVLEMLLEKGIDWNDCPDFFKRGTFFQRRRVERTFTEEERMRIPEDRRPSKDTTFVRRDIVKIDMPSFSKVTNRIEVVFDGAKPIVMEE